MCGAREQPGVDPPDPPPPDVDRLARELFVAVGADTLDRPGAGWAAPTLALSLAAWLRDGLTPEEILAVARAQLERFGRPPKDPGLAYDLAMTRHAEAKRRALASRPDPGGSDGRPAPRPVTDRRRATADQRAAVDAAVLADLERGPGDGGG